MRKFVKIIILIIVGLFLLGVTAVIKAQSGTNLTWLVAVLILVLYRIIPTKD